MKYKTFQKISRPKKSATSIINHILNNLKQKINLFILNLVELKFLLNLLKIASKH